jgi:hypothetical protein
MTSRSKFLVISLFIAFVTKVIGEFVHEVMGHGFFILLFGGKIINVHLSLLWPYELSYIVWSGTFMPWQQRWIVGGGILVCFIVSGILQSLLLFNIVKDWRLSTPLLWLAFWTFLNPTGYLIIGGVKPFGDVASLIADGVLTQQLSLLIGVIVFFVAFLSLSKILITQLTTKSIVKSIKELRLSLALFWAIIPIVTTITCLAMKLPTPYLQIFTILSLLPLPAAVFAPNLVQPNNIPTN